MAVTRSEKVAIALSVFAICVAAIAAFFAAAQAAGQLSSAGGGLAESAATADVDWERAEVLANELDVLVASVGADVERGDLRHAAGTMSAVVARSDERASAVNAAFVARQATRARLFSSDSTSTSRPGPITTTTTVPAERADSERHQATVAVSCARLVEGLLRDAVADPSRSPAALDAFRAFASNQGGCFGALGLCPNTGPRCVSGQAGAPCPPAKTELGVPVAPANVDGIGAVDAAAPLVSIVPDALLGTLCRGGVIVGYGTFVSDGTDHYPLSRAFSVATACDHVAELSELNSSKRSEVTATMHC